VSLAYPRKQRPRGLPAFDLTASVDERMAELIASAVSRERVLHRSALLVRISLVICFSAAALPDSIIFSHSSVQPYYGTVKTAAGAVATICYLVVRHSRLPETVRTYNELIGYLRQQSAKLLGADGLTKKAVARETEQGVSDIMARLHNHVLDDIDEIANIGKKHSGGTQ
jgi:hypothetical protein